MEDPATQWESSPPSVVKIVGCLTWSSDDQKALQRASGVHQLKIVLGGLAGALIGIGLFFGRRDDVVPVYVAPLFFFGLLYAYFQYVARKQSRRTLERQRVDERDIRYELDSVGFSRDTQVSSMRHAWSSVLRHQELEPAFILVVSPTEAVPLMKRAFRPEDVELIRELLRSKVTPVAAQVQPRRFWLVWVLWALILLCFLAIYLVLN